MNRIQRNDSKIYFALTKDTNREKNKTKCNEAGSISSSNAFHALFTFWLFIFIWFWFWLLVYTYREQSTCHAGGEHCTDSLLSLDVLVFRYESEDLELMTSEYERKGNAEKLPLTFLLGW